MFQFQKQNSFFLIAITFELALGLLAIVLATWVGYQPIQNILASFNSLSTVTGHAGWGIGAAIPMAAAAIATDWIDWRPILQLRRSVRQLVSIYFAKFGITQLGIVALSAGVGEELLFRGFLLDAPRQLIELPFSPWSELVGSSLIFGLAHAFSRTYFILATLAGLYLGGLMIITSSLVPAIITHGLYDFVILVYLLWTTGTEMNDLVD